MDENDVVGYGEVPTRSRMPKAAPRETACPRCGQVSLFDDPHPGGLTRICMWCGYSGQFRADGTAYLPDQRLAIVAPDRQDNSREWNLVAKYPNNLVVRHLCNEG